jgi:hypothetical protein
MMDDVALEPCGDLMGGVEQSKRACSGTAAALAIFLRAVNRNHGGLASVCRPSPTSVISPRRAPISVSGVPPRNAVLINA